MFEGLDQIDWSRLTQAYGTAEEVPAYIRALVSSDPETCQKALNSLFNTIFHQGSRYRASAPAVPFLFEALEAPDTREKEQIIQLLEYLAVGYPSGHLQRGFDPSREFARADRLGKRIDLDTLRADAPEEKDDWDIARQQLWKQDAYKAVLCQIDTLRRLTRNTDKKVRMAAVRALAWFPDGAVDSVPFVREIAQSDADPEEQANAIHSLALLDRYLQDRSDVPWLRTRLEPARPYIVRVTTAFSLFVLRGRKLPPEAVELLLETVQDPKKAEAAGRDVSWHWLGLLGEVVDAIRSIRPKPTEAVVAALCAAAEQVQDAMAGVDVFYTLLAVTFPKPKELLFERDKQGFKRLDPKQLNAPQVRALQAIGRSPVWCKEPYFYGRLMDLGLEYGLSWRPERFAEYVQTAERVLANTSDAE